jgi:hypothetical protein
MILDITIPARLDESLPPPAWLVGSIVASAIFIAAALLASLPSHSDHSSATPAPARTESAGLENAREVSIPFDPVSLSLPIL